MAVTSAARMLEAQHTRGFRYTEGIGMHTTSGTSFGDAGGFIKSALFCCNVEHVFKIYIYLLLIPRMGWPNAGETLNIYI